MSSAFFKEKGVSKKSTFQNQEVMKYSFGIIWDDQWRRVISCVRYSDCILILEQELESSDPNFIVVYDLQSGTLFKKWKAGTNTIAITIACQNTCVVASLQDSRILVWDLATGKTSSPRHLPPLNCYFNWDTVFCFFLGNCRWKLLGHTSAADTLNLDGLGLFLLSRDSQDNDRSLRLWNLSTGSYLALSFASIRI